MKKIKEEDRRSIPIPTRWNDKEYNDLVELQKLLGEEKVSTAIKKGVRIARNVIHNTFGEDVVINFKVKKKKFN